MPRLLPPVPRLHQPHLLLLLLLLLLQHQSCRRRWLSSWCGHRS
jgi:hypothetical protein